MPAAFFESVTRPCGAERCVHVVCASLRTLPMLCCARRTDVRVVSLGLASSQPPFAPMDQRLKGRGAQRHLHDRANRHFLGQGEAHALG